MKKLLSLLGAISLTGMTAAAVVSCGDVSKEKLTFIEGKTMADFEALFEEGKIADGKVVNDTKNGMEGPAGSEDFKGDGSWLSGLNTDKAFKLFNESKELEIPEGTDIKTSYAFGIDAKKGDTSITVYLNEIEIEGDISKPEDLKFNISIRNEVVLELTKATTPNPEVPVIGAMEDQTLTVGDEVSVDVKLTNAVEGKEITVKSSDEKIATAEVTDEKITLKAIAAGETTITVCYEGAEDVTFTLTVE